MHPYEVTTDRGTFYVRASDAPAAIELAARIFGSSDFRIKRTDLDPMTLNFPGFPPIRGVGPVITEQTS